jgi:hypothetical protein
MRVWDSGEPNGLAGWLEALARENALRVDGPLRRIG